MNRENFNLILLNAGHAEHFADWNYEKIRSPFARMYYVTEGTAVVNLETASYQLKPNNLYLLPSFTTHSDECTGKFSLFYLHIYEVGSSINSIFGRYHFPFWIEAIPIDLTLIERLISINPNRELKRYDPKIYDNTPTLLNTLAISANAPIAENMETQGILFQLLSRFLKEATPKFVATDKRILNTLEYITKNIEKELCISLLAEICCLSPDHFIRLFKKEMKQTPLAYINERKIERAQSLLTFTRRPIKDIAYQLSFENISYFNRLFKKSTGYTPLEYRMSV